MGDVADAHVLRIRGLHLILLEWLHLDNMLGGNTCTLMITGDFFGDWDCKDREETERE